MQKHCNYLNFIVNCLVLGFAANAEHTHSGGGTNFQCLPPNPQYNKYYTGTSPKWYGSWLAGAEYQDHSYGHIFPHGTYNQNVPCTRCYTKRRAAVMMYPARRVCPTGWTMEYEGIM